MKQEEVVKKKKRRAIEKIRRRQRCKRQKSLILGMTLLVGCLGLWIGLKTYTKGDRQAVQVVEQEGKSRQLKQGAVSAIEVDSNKQLENGHLILVNEAHPIRYYSDEKMVAIGDLLKGICNMKSKQIKLDREAAKALSKMLADFKAEVGESDLNIISGYRDFNTQEALHYQSMLEGGDKVYVAKPDRSEHHTGLAVDFGLCYQDGSSAEYDGSGIYSWINENCYKYGFIMRYDEKKKAWTGIEHEPWHFRYVGRVHAHLMKQLDLCLEEYEALLRNYVYPAKVLKGITVDHKDYAIYYVPATGDKTLVYVPADKNYTLSGNNQDGWIVTVELTKHEQP